MGVGDIDLLPNAYYSYSLTDVVTRVIVFAIAAIFILVCLIASPDKKIILLTKIGKNSLSIYLLHRPITLLFDNIFGTFDTKIQIISAAVLTLILVIILGSDKIADLVNRYLDGCAGSLLNIKKDKVSVICKRSFILIMCYVVIVSAVSVYIDNLGSRTADSVSVNSQTAGSVSINNQNSQTTDNGDPIYRVMTDEEQSEFDNAIRISYVGDLILLEDQVKRAYDGEDYDFSNLFEYTKDYIQSADYSIGVLEGPVGGEEYGYSTSNYDDNKELKLNFPDQFVTDIKEAGFDLVTLANNHILDQGVDAAKRTTSILNNNDLSYVGSYNNADDKEQNNVKLIEVENVRIAVLSYTYGVNGYNTEDLIDSDVSYVTSMLVGTDSKYYEKVYSSVAEDFNKAKSMDPDLIMVLPHWGTQFSDDPDELQTTWQENFKEFGADIILGDHTHSVQPTFMEEYDGRSVFTCYCPGNYSNIYREHNGDCSSIVNVYIDRDTKEVIGGSIIPTWVESSLTGNYQAVSIYDVLTNDETGSEFTTYDLERIEEVQKHITKTMLGEEIDFRLIQSEYFFDENGFIRQKAQALDLNDVNADKDLVDMLSNADNVYFIGDSVTEGTKNGGVGWYEPISYLVNGNVYNLGHGSATTVSFLTEYKSNLEDIRDGDLFVIALGTNDVRYRDDNCALDASQYIENLSEIVGIIKENNDDAQFCFVAPWYSTDGDTVSQLGYKEKCELNTEYSNSLKTWCIDNDYAYVDCNSYIKSVLDKYPQSYYLTDFIHPNGYKGVELYSLAFIQNEQ